MDLLVSLLPDLSPIKGLKRRCLLVMRLLSITRVASAQKGRYLQTLNLYDTENRPFLATSHSLPAYILASIKSGELTPYQVDYATQKAEPFNAAVKESLLYLINVSPYSGEFLSLRMLNEHDVEVTKRIRKVF